LPEETWQTVEVRDGEKGPLLTEVACTSVQVKTEGKVSDGAETLLIFRQRQSGGSWKHNYLLSNEIASNPPTELARVYKAEYRIEEGVALCRALETLRLLEVLRSRPGSASQNLFPSPDHLPWLLSHFPTRKLEERVGCVPYLPAEKATLPHLP